MELLHVIPWLTGPVLGLCVWAFTYYRARKLTQLRRMRAMQENLTQEYRESYRRTSRELLRLRELVNQPPQDILRGVYGPESITEVAARLSGITDAHLATAPQPTARPEEIPMPRPGNLGRTDIDLCIRADKEQKKMYFVTSRNDLKIMEYTMNGKEPPTFLIEKYKEILKLISDSAEYNYLFQERINADNGELTGIKFTLCKKDCWKTKTYEPISQPTPALNVSLRDYENEFMNLMQRQQQQRLGIQSLAGGLNVIEYQGQQQAAYDEAQRQQMLQQASALRAVESSRRYYTQQGLSHYGYHSPLRGTFSTTPGTGIPVNISGDSDED